VTFINCRKGVLHYCILSKKYKHRPFARLLVGNIFLAMSSWSPILLLLLLPADIIHRTNSVRERNGDVRGAFVPKVPIRLHAVTVALATRGSRYGCGCFPGRCWSSEPITIVTTGASYLFFVLNLDLLLLLCWSRGQADNVDVVTRVCVVTFACAGVAGSRAGCRRQGAPCHCHCRSRHKICAHALLPSHLSISALFPSTPHFPWSHVLVIASWSAQHCCRCRCPCSWSVKTCGDLNSKVLVLG
jgi:hypothetical protein